MVMELMADSKLEVREVAATTLAGLLKGAAPPDAAALRQHLQEDAARLFPRSRRRRKLGANADTGQASLQIHDISNLPW